MTMICHTSICMLPSVRENFPAQLRRVFMGFPSDSARNSRVVRARMKSLLRFAREPKEESLSLENGVTSSVVMTSNEFK